MLLAAMEVKAAFGEVVPCMAMVMLEACTIFLTIMASTAMAKFGTNPLVFVVYTNALASIFLVPYSIIYHRRDKVQEKLFTFPLLLRLFFLGLIGGPVVKNYSPTFLHLSTTQFVFSSKDQQNWVLGCLFFIAASLSLSIWNIIQAIFGSIIRSSVQLWCMRMKGPSFPLIFKPVGIVVAISCGCLFFADTFHYGSMFSAFICGMGYYTTIWGQFKDEETQQIKGSSVSLPDEKVPLLRPSQDDSPV
nr:WAT1-related protein At1g70260-like [Ipomoea batatas]